MNNVIARYMLVASLSLSSVFAWATSLSDQAAAAYQQEHYQEALALYQKMEKEEGTSSELFYNMANTYYRMKDTGHAIVYYERALLLNPQNKDARFNLDLVREKAGISGQYTSSVYAQWLDNVMSAFTSNTWAVWAVVLFLLSIAGGAMYLFSDRMALRKTGFFGGLFLLLLSLFAYLCARHMREKVTNSSAAIVMKQPCDFSTVPRQPKDSSEVAFHLPLGSKVEVVDSVRSQQELWLNVEAGENRQAWVLSNEVEMI